MRSQLRLSLVKSRSWKYKEYQAVESEVNRLRKQEKQEELARKDKHQSEGILEGSCLSWTPHSESWKSCKKCQ